LIRSASLTEISYFANRGDKKFVHVPPSACQSCSRPSMINTSSSTESLP
jgi:hypothetical protein